MSYGPDTAILTRRIYESSTSGILDVSKLNIHSLPSLPVWLKILLCHNTRLTSLPPLPDGLQELYCENTLLVSLPPLPDGLRILYCYNTKITSLPPLPKNLKRFECNNTPLTLLPPLPTGLEILWCNNTLLTSLPPLPAGLEILYFNNIQLDQYFGNETMKEYIYRIRRWQEVEVSRKRIQERARLIKEELVAAVWHPRRVQRLIDLCGEDFDFETL